MTHQARTIEQSSLRGGPRWFRLVVAMGLCAVALALAAPTAQAATAYRVTAHIGVGTTPFRDVVNQSTHDVYVTNRNSDTVSVIDESGDATTGSVTATIPVGSVPLGLAVDPALDQVYVANWGNGTGDTVSVIDTITDTVIDTITVGAGPVGVAVDPSTHNVYVTAFGVANTPDGHTVSVIDESGDAATGTVTATIDVGYGPYGMALDPVTHAVYVANYWSGTVSVIDESGDADTGTVTATIGVQAGTQTVAIDPARHQVYAANANPRTVSVIDTNTDTVTDTIDVAPAPFSVAVDLTTHAVYVANFNNGTVQVIDESGDADTNAVTATIRVGPEPWWVDVDQSTHNVYSTDSASDTVSVIRPRVSPEISGTPPPATLGVEYSYQFSVTGIPTPVESTTDPLPSGLHLSRTGLLSGKPTASGVYTFSATAKNALAPTASDPVTLTVYPLPPVRLALAPTSATIVAGQPQSFTATGTDADGNSTGNVTALTTFTITPTKSGSVTGASCSANSCSAVIPGTYKVTGEDRAAKGSATLTVTPTLTSASPPTVAAGGAGTVTFTGTSFEAGATLRLSGPSSQVKVSSVSVVSPATLTATVNVPAGTALGAYTVTITNPDRSRAICTTCFAVIAAPTLTGISPPSVIQGSKTRVTLTGTGFAAGATLKGPSGVKFSEVAVAKRDHHHGHDRGVRDGTDGQQPVGHGDQRCRRRLREGDGGSAHHHVEVMTASASVPGSQVQCTACLVAVFMGYPLADACERLNVPERRGGAPPGCRSYTDDQGLMSSTPTPAKSFSFLVAKDASLARQMAAI